VKIELAVWRPHTRIRERWSWLLRINRLPRSFEIHRWQHCAA